MTEVASRALLMISGAYVLVGVGVAVVFLIRWLGDLDPSANDGSRGFRAMVIPGLIALWPWILIRVFTKGERHDGGGAEKLRRRHRVAILLLAVIGTLLFAGALAWRAPGFDELPTAEIPDF